jgi:sugar lactone lactonase YvrE
MLEKGFKTTFIGLTVLALISCTGPTVPNTAHEDGLQEYNFSSKSLTESYIRRKLQKFAFDHSESKILKELLYGMHKGSYFTGIFENILCSDSSLKTSVFDAQAVKDRIATDTVFSTFMNDLDNSCQPSNSGQIITIAGIGIPGFTVDGEQATSASLDNPEDVAVDSNGNIYIADSNNNRIRKVDTNGVITTIAGNGDYVLGDDNIEATSASLAYPSGLVVAPSGVVYISDTYNSRVRKVDLNGIITTVAGNGTYGNDGDNGPATSATLSSPNSIDLDSSGNLYIADWDNNRVRKVTPGGTITNFAGGGNLAGSLSDGNPATQASINGLTSVAVDRSSGKVYIIDRETSSIRVVGIDGIINTFAGNGSKDFSGDDGQATSASLGRPFDLAAGNDGNVYINDYENYRVRKVATSGIITTIAGNGTSDYSGDGGQATEAGIYPDGIAVDSSGNLYIADTSNYRIRKVFK